MAGIMIKADDFIAKRKAIRKNQRYIGVEIEMGLKSRTTRSQIKKLVEAPVGLEGRIKEQEIMRYAGEDGTGIEYSILPTQLEIWLENNPTLAEIKKRFDEASSLLKAEPGNGVHIHYSIKPEDPEDLPLRALWFSAHASSILEKIAGRSSHWAQPLIIREPTYDKFKKNRNQDYSYNSKSLQFTYKPGIRTLEWRGPKSTNDFNQIVDWVKFYHNLIELLSKPTWQDIPICAIVPRSIESALRREERSLNNIEKRTIITKEGAKICV